MNILDENIDSPTRARLRRLNVAFRHIGTDIGHSGMKDLNDVIPLLHEARHSTFFTRDGDFYSPALIHSGYCLVYLDVRPAESAEYIARFLRHREFRNRANRMGNVIRVHHGGVTYRNATSKGEKSVRWRSVARLIR